MRWYAAPDSGVELHMEIRTLTPDDADAFQRLRLRGLLECPTAFASSYAEEQGETVADVAKRLSVEGDGAVLGAFQGRALVGILGVQREGMIKLSHKAFIWGMYVAPEARRNGISTLLLQRALLFAAEDLRAMQVNLGVNTKNNAALAVYRRFGFKVYGHEQGFLRVDGELHDEYHMVCQLSGAV